MDVKVTFYDPETKKYVITATENDNTYMVEGTWKAAEADKIAKALCDQRNSAATKSSKKTKTDEIEAAVSSEIDKIDKKGA
jgi:hypothetical protein